MQQTLDILAVLNIQDQVGTAVWRVILLLLAVVKEHVDQ